VSALACACASASLGGAGRRSGLEMFSSCGRTRVQLLKRYGGAARVDILERLPTPFGLAPDHPDTKARRGSHSRSPLRDLSPVRAVGSPGRPGPRRSAPACAGLLSAAQCREPYAIKELLDAPEWQALDARCEPRAYLCPPAQPRSVAQHLQK